MAGKQTEVILNNSNLLKYYMAKPPRGRRSLISSEFPDYGKTTAMSLTPEDKGLFILIPTYYPEIFMHSDNEADKRVCKGILNYIAQVTKSVDGIQAKTLEKSEPDYKTMFFNTPLYTHISNPTKEITFNIPAEISGYGITEFVNLWCNEIVDEYTKFSPYNGLSKEWNNWSHSCGFMYLKPNKNMTRLNYGALFFQMVPTTIPYDAYNADATSPGIIDLSLTFSCCFIDTRNLLVREICESALAKYKAILVDNSSQYGSVKNTYLSALDDINPDNMMEDLVVK